MRGGVVRGAAVRYVEMRRLGGHKKVITATPRQLESMIRISEALARMRLSDTVEQHDVKEALRLMKAAMKQSMTDPNTGLIDMDNMFTGKTSRARSEMRMLKEAVLEKLLNNMGVRASPPLSSKALRLFCVSDPFPPRTLVTGSAPNIRDRIVKATKNRPGSSRACSVPTSDQGRSGGLRSKGLTQGYPEDLTLRTTKLQWPQPPPLHCAVCCASTVSSIDFQIFLGLFG